MLSILSEKTKTNREIPTEAKKSFHDLKVYKANQDYESTSFTGVLGLDGLSWVVIHTQSARILRLVPENEERGGEIYLEI